MPGLAARSEVAVSDDGLVWLRPTRTSLRRRHTLAALLLAVLVLTVMTLVTFIPGIPGVLASLPVVAAGLLVIQRTARGAASRVALSPVGLVMLSGSDAVQLAWAAVSSVQGTPVGRRVRVVVATRERVFASPSTFDAGAAADWLTRVTEEARRRNLDPQPSGTGLGFTTT
jgi:hypothetical protein